MTFALTPGHANLYSSFLTTLARRPQAACSPAKLHPSRRVASPTLKCRNTPSRPAAKSSPAAAPPAITATEIVTSLRTPHSCGIWTLTRRFLPIRQTVPAANFSLVSQNVSRLVRHLFAHDYADAAPPVFCQADANHFDLWQQRMYQSARHRVETQRRSNEINQ